MGMMPGPPYPPRGPYANMPMPMMMPNYGPPPPGMMAGPGGPRGPPMMMMPMPMMGPPRGVMMPMMGPPPPMAMMPRGPRPLFANLPDYLPGAASLFEQLDKQILVRVPLPPPPFSPSAACLWPL